MYEAILEKPRKSSNAPVVGETSLQTSRYFIELHVESTHETSRVIRDQLRRQQALEFTQIVRDWVKDNNHVDDVHSLSVTAMGQIMIVCTKHVIDFIRDQDIWGIAHIRSSDQFSRLAHRGRKN